MNLKNVILIVLLSSLISLIGTMTGASIGIFFKRPSQKLLGAILGFAGGLMLAIVVFDLIPESIEKWSFSGTIGFSIIGILIVMAIDNVMTVKEGKGNTHYKVALLTALGLMLHNLPEGVIMGCGFVAGKTLGLKMSVIIAIHDIPEGMAVSAPLMVSRVGISKILSFVFITALPTAVGAWFGIFAGEISQNSLGACLAIASGIMLYVVCGELLPESSRVWDGTTSTLGVLTGVISGLIMINVI
ncbi:MAG: ZIP family metal transporter [Bacillota bacterium]|nr:ZIP family metal transporter [Bacillota bacterium]